MDVNNTNQSANTCGCQMCQKWGWCPAGKWHKIVKVVLLLIILCCIVSFFTGGHGYRDDNKIVNTITVSGKGEISVKPDIATVSFGVSAENLDVAKAQTESATKINNIIAFLKTKNVADKEVKTTNYNIYPRYNYGPVTQAYPYGGKQILAAYVVSQTVEVKIRDISQAGDILSGVGEFGVTDVSGLTFTVDNDQAVKDQARDLAIQDAKTQAQSEAKSLGVKLVRITAFSESNTSPIYYGLGAKMMDSVSAPAVAPQIPTGENTITANVSITYEIR